MTLFQTLAMWLLRFILAWGGFELGMSLYADALALTEQANILRNHTAAMDRLNARAEAAEHSAQAQRSALDSIWVWPLAAERSGAQTAPSALIADALRGDLTGAGASELVLDSAEAPVTAGLSKIVINARWREPPERAPFALQALAARRPRLSVVALSVQQRDGVVETQARFEAHVRSGAHR